MGACISSNHMKESSKQTATSPTSRQVEINADIGRKNMGQTFPNAFPKLRDNKGNNQKGKESFQKGMMKSTDRESLSQKFQDVTSSLNGGQLQNDSGVRAVRHVVISKNCLNKCDQYKKASIEKQENSPSPLQIINHLQQPTSQFSNYSPIQTIQSRILNIDQNMLGKGLTVSDNQIIQSTLLVTEPFNLPAVKFMNGSTYYGEWSRGQRQGYGIVVWQNGSRYEGQWHRNCSEGQGKLIYNGRGHYQGQFLRNCRHGYGVYVNDGKSYKGEWKNDKKQGRGIEIWGNNQYYDGQWLGGNKNGYGELYFQDGSYYKGTFRSNQIHGFGLYQWKNSRTYEGQWQHNTMCGKGILKWINGDKYDGNFKNNKMHGNGIFTHTDGRISQGEYQNGKKQGLFVQITLQKKAIQVQYLMGKIKVKSSRNKQQRRDSNTVYSVTTSI